MKLQNYRTGIFLNYRNFVKIPNYRNFGKLLNNPNFVKLLNNPNFVKFSIHRTTKKILITDLCNNRNLVKLQIYWIIDFFLITDLPTNRNFVKLYYRKTTKIGLYTVIILNNMAGRIKDSWFQKSYTHSLIANQSFNPNDLLTFNSPKFEPSKQISNSSYKKFSKILHSAHMFDLLLSKFFSSGEISVV